jgi:hypothetical protein
VLSLWRQISNYFWWNISAIDLPSSSLLHRKPRFHPALFAFGIVRHVRVTHRRQFTGGIFTGVSMSVRAVGDDLSFLVGQHLRGKFLNTFRWNVQRSGDMSFSVTFGRESLDKRDSLLPTEFRFEVFSGNCAIHIDLLNAQS